MSLLKKLLENNYFTWFRRIQFILAIIIFASAALMPSPDSVGLDFDDVILHIAGNILLMISAWFATMERFKLWVPLFFAISYSCVIELSQTLTQHRSSDMEDLVFNLIGITIGFTLCYGFQFLYQKISKSNV